MYLQLAYQMERDRRFECESSGDAFVAGMCATLRDVSRGDDCAPCGRIAGYPINVSHLQQAGKRLVNAIRDKGPESFPYYPIPLRARQS